MKKGRFLWSAHRITEKQKAGKARNIKEKQLKNSRDTVLMSIPCSRDKVAKLCRKSWKRILGTPALSFTCVLFFGNRINFFIPAVKRSKRTPADLHTGYD